MTSNRPACVHCGKRYGRRATTQEVVRWKAGQEQPAYRGNGIVVREQYWGQSISRDLYNEIESRKPERFRSDPPAQGFDVHTAYRDIWDGVTWYGGYEPFCTLICALDYARRAYKARKVA